MIKLFKKYPIFKNVLTMLSSSSVSQVIPFVTAPVLTRLYSPSDFGLYEIYYSIMTIFVVIPNLRLENAVLIEKDDNKSVNIFFICILSNLFFLLLGLIAIFILDTAIVEFYDLEVNSTKWLYFIPVGMFLSSTYNLFSLWLVRYEKYKGLSINRILLTVSNALIQISFGLLFFGFKGLIYGNVLSYFLSLILMGYSCIKILNVISFKLNKKDFIDGLRSNKDFIFYTLPGDFINGFANQLPTLLIGKYFNSASLGYYSMARRIVGLPLGFISGAIQDVFKKESTNEYNEKGTILKTYKVTFLILLVFGMFLVGGIYIFGDTLITLFLGINWEPSIPIIKILSVLFVLKFISGTLNFVFLIRGKQKLDLYFQFLQLIVVLITFNLSKSFGFNFYETILFYVIIISGYSMLNLKYSYKYAKFSE